MRLEYLCDLNFGFDGPPTLVRPFGSEEGTVFGAGSGSVSGERLRGAARWVNLAHRRSDGVMQPDLHGVITTERGTQVAFTMQGLTTWVQTTDGPAGCQTLRVLFETEDPQLRWLNGAVCVSEGKVSLPNPSNPARLLEPAKVYVCVNESVL
ncbi:MAG TPA: DUF3237 family protein [Ktedonobacterales bacterium]|nr:DUF3237 family protein [Ktedonobacterales bacterium]